MTRSSQSIAISGCAESPRLRLAAGLQVRQTRTQADLRSGRYTNACAIAVIRSIPDNQPRLKRRRQIFIAWQDSQRKSLPAAGAALDRSGEQVTARAHLPRVLHRQHLRVVDATGR